MKKFRTHLIVDKRDSEKILELDIPGIKFGLIKDSSRQYWESTDGKSSTFTYTSRDPHLVPDGEIPMSELLVEAADEATCEDFLSILQGAMMLAFPEESILEDFIHVTEYDESKNKMYTDKNFSSYLKKFKNVAFGCLVIQKVISDNQLVYSIEKYKTSISLSFFDPFSFDPRYGQFFDHYSINRGHHTRAAFAIVAAFSVIEELGFEIRSSKEKPRFTNVETGEWNTEVLSDVQKRLNEGGIPTTLSFDWIYRGAPTRIEQKIKPYFGFDSEWTKYGEALRDKTLTIPEAIHNASYLRNFIASHRFKELTQYISPYDVFNVQSLSRILILHKIDLWQAMVNRNK